MPQRHGWYPPALRPWNLFFTAVLCWAFIATLQYHLHKSQVDGGIIFALKINDIPLRQAFVYRYLPTVLAVIFSVFIVWIDNDAKRYEPYRQMLKPGGAFGEDSLLLQYPFDFMPFVPIVAAKRRHWLVFWASFATVVTTFGVVPLQAGIFSVERSTQTFPQNFTIAESFNQSSVLEAAGNVNYTHSVYGILTLNQTLPGFMTRNFTLKPFAPAGRETKNPGTWTARTTMYYTVLHCEESTAEEVAGPCQDQSGRWINCSEEQEKGYCWDNNKPVFNCSISNMTVTGFRISAGCLIAADALNYRIIGNQTSDKSRSRNKQYSASYWGYYDSEISRQNPDDRIQAMCEYTYSGARGNEDFETNRIFVAMFAENRATVEDTPKNVTVIFCKPSYHEQDVEATIDAVTKAPLSIVPLDIQRELVPRVFPYKWFEQSLAAGVARSSMRSDSLPLKTLPRYMKELEKTELTTLMLGSERNRSHLNLGSSGDLPAILEMVMTMATDRIQDLVDPRALAEAYQQAYQLLFARAMTDLLTDHHITSTTNVTGITLEYVEAVKLEPIFTYLVEGLLAIVSLASLVLLWIACREQTLWGLRDDPSSIAAIMSNTADDADLLARFEDLDCATTSYFRHSIRHNKFSLARSDSSVSIRCSSPNSLPLTQVSEMLDPDQKEDLQLAQPSRPREFRAITIIPFTGLFVVLAIVLAVLFANSRPHGLSLPSQNRVISNMVTQYLTTAIATLIEPMWVLINRLLCVLQPLEQMRGPRASAAHKSVSLSYSALPPQLSIFKAIRANHFILALVGTMALLANVLATTFAGMFYRQTISLSKQALFEPAFQSSLVYSNVSIASPWDTHFLVAASNYTANTSLPTWTDYRAMYVPFKLPGPGLPTTKYQASTRLFSAEPNCKPLRFGIDYFLDVYQAKWDMMGTAQFWVGVTDHANQSELCFAPGDRFIGNNGDRRQNYNYEGGQCRDGIVALELSTPLQSGRICESAFILGWTRATQPPCDMQAPFPHEKQGDNNTLLISCQPRVKTGSATVIVDSNGVLLEPAQDFEVDEELINENLSQYVTTDSENIIAESNLYLARSLYTQWHNETSAGEYLPYFMNLARGDLHLSDPHTPVPTWADAEEALNAAYGRVFAIWLGLNQERLLLPANGSTPQIQGIEIWREERLLFVEPLLIVSEAILGIYIIVSILVFLRRPGRYLPRLPTSIAANIALFASSAAVKDFQNTSNMTNKERDKYLKKLDLRYGYGSHVSSNDGAVHIGIEKFPLVGYMKKVTFVGSRVEREIRKRRGKSSVGGSSAPSSECVNMLLHEAGEEGIVYPQVARGAVDTPPPEGRICATQDA